MSEKTMLIRQKRLYFQKHKGYNRVCRTKRMSKNSYVVRYYDVKPKKS